MAGSPKQIAAVRKVLYEPRRLRTLADHLSSIDLLMNLDRNRPLQPGDIRFHAGTGPNWFYRDTGQVDASVLEAADRCDQVAALMLEIRSDLAQVNFPSSDKQHLRTALAEQAEAWRARGKEWRAPQPPTDVQAAVALMVAHVRASAQAFKPVAKYLKNVDLHHIR